MSFVRFGDLPQGALFSYMGEDYEKVSAHRATVAGTADHEFFEDDDEVWEEDYEG